MSSCPLAKIRHPPTAPSNHRCTHRIHLLVYSLGPQIATSTITSFEKRHPPTTSHRRPELARRLDSAPTVSLWPYLSRQLLHNVMPLHSARRRPPPSPHDADTRAVREHDREVMNGDDSTSGKDAGMTS
jgi:hypothetical protein